MFNSIKKDNRDIADKYQNNQERHDDSNNLYQTYSFWMLMISVLFFVISLSSFIISIANAAIHNNSFMAEDFLFISIGFAFGFLLASLLAFISSLKMVKDKKFSRTYGIIVLIIFISSIIYFSAVLFSYY